MRRWALLAALLLTACGTTNETKPTTTTTVPVPVTIVAPAAPPTTILVPPDITIPAPPPAPVVPPVTAPPRAVSPTVTVPVTLAPTTVPPPAVVSPWLAAMNADRLAAGIPPLAWNNRLAGIGLTWATQMASTGVLAHSDLQATIRTTSWRTMGENVLTGPATITAVTAEAAWMASPAHRANILNTAFVAAGVGIAFRTDGTVWVAVEFGG